MAWRRLLVTVAIATLVAIVVALWAAPSRRGATEAADVPTDLESVAVARGLIAAGDDADPVGLYARDTDRLCLARQGDRLRAGASVDYGDGLACAAAGTARRSGSTIDFDFGEGCRISARFDGETIAFPAAVPDACHRSCRGRAALDALRVTRLSGAQSEAEALRLPDGKAPCRS